MTSPIRHSDDPSRRGPRAECCNVLLGAYHEPWCPKMYPPVGAQAAARAARGERVTALDEMVVWLREQIAEERRLADEACTHICICDFCGGAGFHSDCVDRLLAEYDAKERLLDLLLHMAVWGSAPGAEMGAALAKESLRVLALPYAGRPGYREEWRP